MDNDHCDIAIHKHVAHTVASFHMAWYRNEDPTPHLGDYLDYLVDNTVHCIDVFHSFFSAHKIVHKYMIHSLS